MEPITLALIILGGISIAASATAFIYDELAEDELEQREQLKNAYNEYVNSKKTEIENNKNNYYSLLRDTINNQREQKKKIKEEFQNALNTIKFVRKTGEYTSARKRAFDKLYLTFTEQISKVYGYFDYLQFYSKQLNKLYSADKSLPEAPSFILPNNFPYDGKLMYVDFKELTKNGFENEFNIEYELIDFELKDNYEENSRIPVFVSVIYDKIKDRKVYYLSIAKGLLKEQIEDQGIPFESTVKKVEKNYSILDYYGLNLKLDKDKQENSSRSYFRGNNISVYPYFWYSNLNNLQDSNESNIVMKVTERWEQSINETYFDEIPIIIEDHFLQELTSRLEGFENSSERWLISPSKKSYVKDLSSVKVQLGYEISFECSIEGINFRNPKDSKLFFKFVKYLDIEDKIKADDIYVSLAVTLIPLSENETDIFQNQFYENFKVLYFFLIEEFIAQKKIIESRQGKLYYNKWAMIFERLINHISKGPEIILDVNRTEIVKKSDNKFYCDIYINNKLELIKYIESNKEDPRKVDYFIKQKNVNLGVPIIDELHNSKIKVFNSLPENEEPISMYKKLFPLPEIRQRIALKNFKNGFLYNPLLTIFLLNPEEIKSEQIDENFNNIKFYDKNIISDKNQQKTVIKALNEKNLFLIQGPPGTGKTTVIVEIILQYLKKFKKNKILIVSQANIAVDNVLEKLLQHNKLINKDFIVRCGQGIKITDKIKSISIETKYNKYRDDIINYTPQNEEKQYHDFWLDLIGQNDEINPDIGELILKSHQIIGATCVGLANKRIGLERMNFDLVIIDEAGKATAGELLIPLIRGEKVIIVGDHYQLPPSIHRVLLNDEIPLEIEKNELEIMYRESLFERLYKGAPDTNKAFLSKQFRMPPSIGTMISELFYNGKLINGKEKKPPEILKNHITWIDTSKVKNYKHSIAFNKSPFNNSEIEIVNKLLKWIIKRIKNKKILTYDIIVITPYSSQKYKLRKSVIEDNFFKSIPKEINLEINTVDAIQGRDADLIIYCTTRTRGNIDFLNDKHRLNVALSRVKSDLIIIGKISYYNTPIETSEGKNYFKDLIEYIKKSKNDIIPFDSLVK